MYKTAPGMSYKLTTKTCCGPFTKSKFFICYWK
uniref:Uncharacterized protein n=1 Tax=Arundo donax TaxID=35708 RepID=A0A0A9BN00_ARUDO